MQNTVQHIHAKVHPATASISVKFRGMKEDTGIPKHTTNHFHISYRSQDMCLDCGSFINISDWIVQKITFTETIIYEMIQHEYYGVCKSVFKRHRVVSNLIFVPIVFHSLHGSQQSLRHVYFLHCSLISVQPLHFYISLWNLQIALVTDFRRVTINTLVLLGWSKAACWPRWYKRYVTKVLYVYRNLFGTCSQRTISFTLQGKPEYTEMACVLWVLGK